MFGEETHPMGVTFNSIYKRTKIDSVQERVNFGCIGKIDFFASDALCNFIENRDEMQASVRLRIQRYYFFNSGALGKKVGSLKGILEIDR